MCDHRFFLCVHLFFQWQYGVADNQIFCCTLFGLKIAPDQCLNVCKQYIFDKLFDCYFCNKVLLKKYSYYFFPNCTVYLSVLAAIMG